MDVQLATNPNWIRLAMGWPDLQIVIVANWQINKIVANRPIELAIGRVSQILRLEWQLVGQHDIFFSNWAILRIG